MLKNIGTVDRVIRALAAVVIAVLYSTAVVWCPAYMPFGISTCRKPTGGAAPKA